MCLEYSDVMEGGERRLERTDPGGPSGPRFDPEGMGSQPRFQAGPYLAPCGERIGGEGRVQGLFLKLEHRYLGHRAGAPGYAPAKGQ